MFNIVKNREATIGYKVRVQYCGKNHKLSTTEEAQL